MEVFNIGSLNLLRTPPLIDDGKLILSFGSDNLYPQRIKQAGYRSPLVKSAIFLIADFLEGDGFETSKEENINDYGHTDNDLLRLVSEDFSLFEGFAILVNFDGTGEKTSYFSIPFEWVRFAKPGKDGRIKHVYVSNQWEVIGANGEEAKRYPLITPGEEISAMDAPEGAIMYFTGLRQQYPVSRMDAVFDSAQADAEVQTFELSNINNGFLSATIFKHFGGFKSKREREKYQENISELIGAENANSVFIIDLDEDLKDSELFEQLPANNNDTLFDSTVRNILNRILQHFNVPPSLMGVTSDGAVFTQADISKDFNYMNERTSSDRKILERIFKALEINESLITVKSIDDGGESIPNAGESPEGLANDGQPIQVEV